MPTVGLNYFDRVAYNSQPHPVFSVDWTSYDELQFASAFLPHSEVLDKPDFYLCDAAELFRYKDFTDPLVFDLWPNDDVVQISIFSYAENTEVAARKERYKLTRATLAILFEVTRDDQVKVEIRLGDGLRNFLSELQRKNKSVYKKRSPILTQTLTRQQVLQKTVGIKSHRRLLEFAFNLMEIDSQLVVNEAQQHNLLKASQERNEKRKKKKVLDPAGGHVIDTTGNIIWRSPDNPDNGYTWRYMGSENISGYNNSEVMDLKGLELITYGTIDKDGKTEMNFVAGGVDPRNIRYVDPIKTIEQRLKAAGKDFKPAFQGFIQQQADSLGIPVSFNMRPNQADNIAFVPITYGPHELDTYTEELDGWPENVGMGSIYFKSDVALEMVWNSRFGNKIPLANIYDVRSALIHEYDHYTTNQKFPQLVEKKLRAYAEEKNITADTIEDLERKVRERLKRMYGDQADYSWNAFVARIWFYEIDKDFFMPASKHSTPFMELKAYAAQFKHPEFKEISFQNKVLLYNKIYGIGPEFAAENTPPMRYVRLQGKNTVYFEPERGLIGTRNTSNFWNHGSYREYMEFINQTLEPLIKAIS